MDRDAIESAARDLAPLLVEDNRLREFDEDWLRREKANRAYPIIFDSMQGAKEIEPAEDFADYAEIYRVNPWSYAATFEIATAASGIPWRLEKQDKNGWTEDTSHWIAEAIAAPQPKRSFADLLFATFGFLELVGNSYWALETEGSALPNEIWYLRPDRVRPIPDRETEVSGYRYRVGLESVDYEADEVVHIQYWNPLDDTFGQGSITAARNAHISDLAATRWNKDTFQRGTSGTVVIAKEEMEAPQIKRLRERIKEQYQGGRRGVDVFWEIDLKEIGLSAKDAEFLGLKKSAMLEILASHGVPPAIVGVLEYANYATFKEQTRIFWNKLKPKLRFVRDAVNLQWITPATEGQRRLNFDLSDVEAFQEDKNAKVQRQAVQFANGFRNRNEIRAEDGLGEVPGGDVFYLPAMAIPAGGSPSAAPSSEASYWGGKETDRIRPALYASETARERTYLTGRDIDLRLPDSSAEANRLERRTRELRLKAAEVGSLQVVEIASGKAYGAEILKQDIPLVGPEDPPSGEVVEIQFDIMADPHAQELLATEGARKAKYITEKMRERIKVELYSGVELGENLTQLSDRVDEATADLKRAKFWALRIARTEIRQAQNYGADLTMKRLKVGRKVWIASPSPLSRELHLATDAQSHAEPVEVGKNFLPIDAEFPGGSGRAGDDINCRCDSAPWIAGLSGKQLREWTGIFRRVKDGTVANLESEWIDPLHRYLDEYASRIKEALA